MGGGYLTYPLFIFFLLIGGNNMGLFTSGVIGPMGNINDLLEDDTLNIHESMSLMEAAYAGIAESEMNWNAIMEAVAMTEMEEASNGNYDYDVTLESGFVNSIVSFFKKIWEKIKGLFKKFMVMLGSMVGKDRDFAKKYGNTIRESIKNIPSDAEFKGYNFTTEVLHKSCTNQAKDMATMCERIETLYNKASAATDTLTADRATSIAATMILKDTLKGLNISDNDDYTDIIDKIRGDLIGESSATDAELREGLFKVARNNEDSPIDIKMDGTLVSYALSSLEDGDKAKSKADKLYGELEKEWKSSLKHLEKIENELYRVKADPGDKAAAKNVYGVKRNVSNYTKLLNIIKSCAGIIQTSCGVHLQAVKDEYSQCRRICAKVVTYKSNNEGAMVSHYSESTDYFTPVNLI